MTSDEIKNLVENRFSAMRVARSVVDKNWDIYQKMIDAVFIPYEDERSSSTVPLASSIIELYVSEAIKIPTEYHFKPISSKHQAAAKALEYVWKFDWRQNNRKKIFTRDEYTAAGFGTSIIYTGYERIEKTQKDVQVDDNGNITFVDKPIKKNNIVVSNTDIRQFYVDNEAIEGIEDANDCILIQWIGFKEFQEFANNPMYKDIDKVKPIGYNNTNKPFVVEGDEARKGEYVKLTHYWNLKEDLYCVVANGELVREHPIMSTIAGEKALPFTVRGFGYKNFGIYHRGLCESLMMFNSEINNLREMLMDGIRRSNQPTIAIGNGLSFDGRSISFQNEILTFTGDLSNNFQQIAGTPPNQAIFSYLERIYKDIAVFCGIDINNIIGSPNQTAFQTEVQREASQKRINVWLTNRDLAMERFANLHKDNLQMWFPRKDANDLYPEIEVEDQKLVGKGDKAKFKKTKGSHTFQVTPEILRGEIYIDVFTNTNVPTINAVDREQKLQLLNAVGPISQGYALAKQAGFDIESILPIKSTMRDLASDFNLTPSDGESNEDVEKAKQESIDMFKAMMPQVNSNPQLNEGISTNTEAGIGEVQTTQR